jgi:hypothetical protein
MMQATEVMPATTEAPPPTNLFSGDPEQRLEAARRIANALAPIIERQGLYVTISGKRYVLHEGWTTLGAMVGLFAYVTETRPTPERDGWEARVEIRRLDGTVLSAAEAECRRDEPHWQDRPSYALRSMAQTRASAKAHRLLLGWVMTLAGYEPTPAEEMTAEAIAEGPREQTPQPRTPQQGKGDFQQQAQEASQQRAVYAWARQPRTPQQGKGDFQQQAQEASQQRAVYGWARQFWPDMEPHYAVATALNLPSREEGAIREHWLTRGTWSQAAHALRRVKAMADDLETRGWARLEALEEAARRYDAYGKLSRGESLP